jgi:hypothetical protein
MRLSVNINDLGFKTLCETPKARGAAIFFNGEPRKLVETADEERGFIDALAMHNGEYVVIGGTLLVHRLWGEVRIEIPDA